jgi:hypothetical protein
VARPSPSGTGGVCARAAAACEASTVSDQPVLTRNARSSVCCLLFTVLTPTSHLQRISLFPVISAADLTRASADVMSLDVLSDGMIAVGNRNERRPRVRLALPIPCPLPRACLVYGTRASLSAQCALFVPGSRAPCSPMVNLKQACVACVADAAPHVGRLCRQHGARLNLL